jgi:hypothetical protein
MDRCVTKRLRTVGSTKRAGVPVAPSGSSEGTYLDTYDRSRESGRVGHQRENGLTVPSNTARAGLEELAQ